MRSRVLLPQPLGPSHVADAAARTDQLGDDDVSPGPAEHHAQGLGNFRRRAGQEHAADQAGVAAAQGVGGLDQVAPCIADGHRDHQHQLEEAADEDHRQLLRFADARPEDQQRDEGTRRQVAGERDEGLEEGFDGFVGAHCHPQRQGQRGGNQEAADHAPHRHADVLGEALFGEQVPAAEQHL